MHILFSGSVVWDAERRRNISHSAALNPGLAVNDPVTLKVIGDKEVVVWELIAFGELEDTLHIYLTLNTMVAKLPGELSYIQALLIVAVRHGLGDLASPQDKAPLERTRPKPKTQSPSRATRRMTGLQVASEMKPPSGYGAMPVSWGSSLQIPYLPPAPRFTAWAGSRLPIFLPSEHSQLTYPPSQ